MLLDAILLSPKGLKRGESFDLLAVVYLDEDCNLYGKTKYSLKY